MKALISMSVIEEKILLIRGQKVMLDADLAELYGVSTKALNHAVKRNRDRFRKDFMFQLTAEERELVTNCHRFDTMKHASASPAAFTEHGAVMAGPRLGE